MLLRMQNLEVNEEQRLLAADVLTAVRKIDRRAIIAGGAPRDWYLGMRANDIDIFINGEVFRVLGRDNFLYLLVNVIDAMTGGQYTYDFTELGQELSQEYASEHIHRVFQAEINGQVFQFIVYTGSTFNIVRTFPFTVSRGWCTPRDVLHGDIHVTYPVARDLQGRVLRYTETLSQRNQRYFNKIVERFPDWELVLPTPEPIEPTGAVDIWSGMRRSNWFFGTPVGNENG